MSTNKAICDRLLSFLVAMGFKREELSRLLGVSEELAQQLREGTRDLRKDTEVIRSIERVWGSGAATWILTGNETALNHAEAIALRLEPR